MTIADCMLDTENAMILKEVTGADNSLAGMVRRIQLSAKGLKLGVQRHAPACGAEQQTAGTDPPEKAKNDKNEA